MFLKSLLLGVRRRVGEPILILITVAISVAVFVSALALRASIEKTAIASYRALSGECELEATLEKEDAAYYLTTSAEEYLALEAAVEPYGELRLGYLFYASIGTEKGEFAEIYATDPSSLISYNPITFLSGGIGTSEGDVILGERFAEKIGARVGDVVTASRYGGEGQRHLVVSGIAKGEGLFTVADAIVSEVAAARLLKGDEVKVYNRFFIDLSDDKLQARGVTAAEATARIAELAPDFRIESPVNEKNVAISLSQQTTLLLVISMIVAVLGAVLIYTAVSLVMKNRLSTAALFKSVGAESGKLALYLLAEILLYGVFGSLIGVAGSYGFGALFGRLMGTVGGFAVGGLQVLFGVIFGVVLSLVAASIPVFKLAYTPLSELLRSRSPVISVKWIPAVVAGAIFLVLFVVLPFVGVSAAFAVGAAAAGAMFLCLFALMPVLIAGLSRLIGRWTRNVPKAGRLYLAAAGARSNRHAHSGARLLAIALTAVVTTTILLTETTSQMRLFEKLFRADLMISADADTVPEIAADVRKESGVTGAYLGYVETRCALVDNDENTVTLLAVNEGEYADVFDVRDFGLDPKAIAGARKVALSGGLALKLGLSVGDEFALVVKDQRIVFTLSALIDTPLTVVFTDLSGLGIDTSGRIGIELAD